MVAGHKQFDESDNSLVAREPENQLINWPRSDGVASHRPSADMFDRTAVNGEVNYFRKVFVNEPASASWRMKLGVALAEELQYDTSKKWYIPDWPKGYELFAQFKGPKSNPRADLYLFGRGEQRFRSANEFIPHARWLFQDSTLDRGNCRCKYCGNVKSQRHINFQEGLGPPTVPPPVALSSGSKRERMGSASDPGPSTSRAKKPRPSGSRPQTPPLQFQPAVQYLESDLRTSRRFRSGEMVWVHIRPSILSPDNDVTHHIHFWPAIVQEARTVKEVAPHTPGQSFVTKEILVYRIQIMPTTTEYVLPEEGLLPYQAYAPPEVFLSHAAEILKTISTLPDPSLLSRFQPMPDSLRTHHNSPVRQKAPDLIPLTYENAILTWLAAFSMAKNVASDWCATDLWEFVSVATADRPSIKQQRYQGVWWGPERIWVGELIRLRPPRSILSGDLLPSSRGAEGRSLILKLEAIYMDKATSSNGPVDVRVMISGTLYEVANAHVAEGNQASGAASAPPPSSDIKLHGIMSLPLPPPPTGYQFRSITPSPDLDVHFDLYLIAGRYYPNLRASPLIAFIEADPNASHTLLPQSLSPRKAHSKRIESLELMQPGSFNQIDAYDWKEGRGRMFDDAKVEAFKELIEMWDRNQPRGVLPIPKDVIVKQEHIVISYPEDDLFGGPGINMDEPIFVE